MATHSNILAWRIPWTEEPGGLQFMGSWSQTQLCGEATCISNCLESFKTPANIIKLNSLINQNIIKDGTIRPEAPHNIMQWEVHPSPMKQSCLGILIELQSNQPSSSNYKEERT